MRAPQGAAARMSDPGDPYLVFALCLALYLAASTALYALGLGTGAVFAAWWGILALGLAAVAARMRPRHGLAFAAVLAAGLGLSRLIDVSHDGLHYHLPAALEIAAGRNPVLETGSRVWSAIYPSGTWRLAAPLTEIPALTTPAAPFNLLFAVLSGLLLERLLRQGGQGMDAASRALVWATAFSPIVVAQLVSGMQDGLLCSVFLCTVFLTGCLVGAPGPARALDLLALGALAVILVSTKTAGIAYAGLALAIGIAGQAVLRGGAGRALLVTAGAAILVALAVNARPILTNVALLGTPFPDAEAIVRQHVPPVLQGAPRHVLLAAPVFGETAFASDRVFRWPWQVSPSEIRSADAGTPMGGFGPFFDSVVIASVLCVLAGLWRGAGRADRFLPIAAGGILAFFAIFPEPWWARFVAPVAAVPALAVLSLRAAVPRALAWACALVALLNAAVFAVNAGASQIALQERIAAFREAAPSLRIVPAPEGPFRLEASLHHILGGYGFERDGQSCDARTMLYDVDICFDLP